MKNIIYISLIAASVFGCKNSNQTNKDDHEIEKKSTSTITESVEELTDSIQIKNIQIGSESPDEKNRFHVSYPNTKFDFINKQEEEMAQTYLSEFQENSKKFDENAVAGIDFGQHFEVIEHNSNFMAFFIERYASYGNNYDDRFFTHLYDLKQKKILNFSDLFDNKQDFEDFTKIIKVKTEKILKDKIDQMDGLNENDRKTMWQNMTELFEEGIAPNNENYHAFRWDETGKMTIYFDKYQLASGNFGNIQVSLKPEEFQSLISGKYQSLFHFKKKESKSEPTPETKTTSKSNIDCGKEPCIALTFDDGPSIYTDRLLDILKENDVKATFFVLGKSAKVQRKTLLRTFNEGHQIGNHSWDHKDLKKLSKASIEKQIYDTNDVIKSITGVAPKLLRPPYGSFDASVKDVAKMPIILWNLDPLDWKDRDANIVADRINKAVPNGVVLAHDIHKTTVDAMPKVISTLKSKGYHLVTIDELFAGKELKNGQVYDRRK